jgi:hypothetical protein
MSLINDALKRASQSDRNRARPAEPRAPMEPPANRPGQFLPVALGAGIVLALGLAGWFFSQWWNTSHAPAPVKVETVVAVAPKPAPAPVAQATVPPPVVAAPMPVATPAPAPAPPAKPAEEAWPVNLKVMGIFFSQTNPKAIINGKTVGVGDEISGIRVSKIGPDRVTVEWHGKVKELVIE